MRFTVGGSIQVTAHRREEVKEVFQVDKPIQILVVSSEFTNCDVLKDIINREGWKMVCAATVRESSEVLANENIDLVFSDRCLADGTYRDVLVIMRLLRRYIRMIVTSRLADWDEYLEAVHDGAFDLIASPSRAADLVRVVSQAQSENQKIRRAVAVDNAPVTSVGGPLEPPFTMSKSRSIERYPSMTSPIGSSPQTLPTEDWHFCPWLARVARIKLTWRLGVFVSPVCRSTQSLRCLTKSKQQAEPIHKRVGAMTVAKLSNKGAVTQRSKANFFRNVDVKPVKSNPLPPTEVAWQSTHQDLEIGRKSAASSLPIVLG